MTPEQAAGIGFVCCREAILSGAKRLKEDTGRARALKKEIISILERIGEPDEAQCKEMLKVVKP